MGINLFTELKNKAVQAYHRISAPQLTPFREDGSINYGEYTRLTQFITDAGVHGVFVCGTTGEFVNLTLEERKRLLTAAVEGAVFL